MMYPNEVVEGGEAYEKSGKLAAGRLAHIGCVR
jgi:hypothetical protein